MSANVSFEKEGCLEILSRTSLRFSIVVNAKSREVLTPNDVSESSIRAFFTKQGVSDSILNQVLEKAKQRYAALHNGSRVDQAADTADDDDLMSELGLDE